MIICKGVRKNDDLTNGAPEDTIFATFPKGYIDSDKQNTRKRVAVQLHEVNEEESCNESTVSGADTLN
jgi:hypothetical protein